MLNTKLLTAKIIHHYSSLNQILHFGCTHQISIVTCILLHMFCMSHAKRFHPLNCIIQYLWLGRETHSNPVLQTNCITREKDHAFLFSQLRTEVGIINYVFKSRYV
ncbi:hypothetical protein Hanom_Chr16g01459801 [Helianthus anomalus]